MLQPLARLKQTKEKVPDFFFALLNSWHRLEVFITEKPKFKQLVEFSL